MKDKYERVTDTMLVSHDDGELWTLEMLGRSPEELREQVRLREPAVFLAGIYIADQAVTRLVGLDVMKEPGPVIAGVADDMLRAVLIGYELGRRGSAAFYRDLLPEGMAETKQKEPDRE